MQRVLAARSSLSARAGIVAAGYLKLLIPFVSVVGGMAAGHLFQARVDAGILPALPQPDDAFPLLVQLIVPAGYGLIGLVTAGLIGAILSSLDSLMNSGATLFTFDFYRRFMRRDAGERELLLIGRICIVLLVVVAGSLAALAYTENQSDNFFLRLANQTGHLQPGIVVAFLAGVLWRGATASGGFLAILVSPFFSVFIERAYPHWVSGSSGPAEWVQLSFGPQLNFLHRVALTGLFATVLIVVVSRLTQHTRDPKTDRYTWWAYRSDRDRESIRPFWRSERPWAWSLCALTVWILVYFV